MTFSKIVWNSSFFEFCYWFFLMIFYTTCKNAWKKNQKRASPSPHSAARFWFFFIITNKRYCTILYSTVQYCTVLYSTVQYCTDRIFFPGFFSTDFFHGFLPRIFFSGFLPGIVFPDFRSQRCPGFHFQAQIRKKNPTLWNHAGIFSPDFFRSLIIPN